MAEEEEIVMKISLEGATEELNNLTRLKTSVNELAEQKKEYNNEQKDLALTLAELNTQYESLNEAEKENEEVGGVLNEQIKEQEQSIVELTAQQVQLGIDTKNTTTEFREAEKAVIDNEKANNANEGSIAQMRVELAAAQREYVGLSEEQRNNEEIGGALQESISAQSDELKALEKDIGITSRSVGDYGSALDGALPLMGGFGKQIQGVIGQLSGVKKSLAGYVTAQQGANAATKGTNTGLKLFRVALIATGIGAIVVILGTLISAFLSTQRGADAITSVLRPLQEVFQSIFGVIQKLASGGVDKLKKAFSDPKQAVLDLGAAIKKNFIARITGGVKLVKAAGAGFIASFKLIGLGIKKALSDVPLIGKGIDKVQLDKDLKEAALQVKAAAEQIKEGVVELTLGVDIDTAKKAAEEAREFIGAAVERGQAIDKLTKQIERRAVSLNREVKTGNRLYEVQKALAEDVNIGSIKQLEAAEKAQQILKNTTAIQVAQKNNEIKLAKLKAEANDTDRETQEQIQDLIGEREELEGKAIKKGLLLRNKANSIASKEEAKRIRAIAEQEKEVEKGIKERQKAEIAAIDSKIKALELGRELELALTDETNEQKLKKEKELLEKVTALKLESATSTATLLAEKQTAGIKDEVKREEEKEKIINDALSILKLENKVALAENEREIDDEQKEREAEDLAAKEEEDAQKLTESEEAKQAITDSFVEAGQTVQKEIFKNQNRRIDESLSREVEALNARRQAGEISEEEFNKKRLALDKKAFSDRKKLSLAQVAIDFAVAAGKTLASTGIAGLPLLVPLAVQAAVQSGIIASQTFAKGGIIHGASHANGGVQLGNNQEAEGGEAIINKRSTAKHLGLLSAINQDGGGVSFSSSLPSPNLSTVTSKFANGGLVAGGGVPADDFLNNLRQAFSESMSTIQVQNVASETTGVANRVQQIEDSASF